MKSWSTASPQALPIQKNSLKLFETTQQQVVPVTIHDEQASMYVCGITPYDATHLGHANTYVAFDILNRYWRACGYQVNYTQNVTDIDDPLFERAAETGVDWKELGQEQTDLFRGDMEILNVLAPDDYLTVTESVDWIIDMVTELLHNGTAYFVPSNETDPEGDIYFDIQAAQKATNWRLGAVGALTEAEMDEVFPERGGDPLRPGKRHPLDPKLWSARRDGEPYWEAGELGDGRPGWHVECSAIARQTLPKPFTVQGGGSDLRFPHHEFSAAHATAVDHEPMAEYFVHAGMVGLDGVKMSKSLGNLVLVSKLHAEGFEGVAIRALLLDNHYRADWSFTREALDKAVKRVQTWREAAACQAPGDGGVVLTNIHNALSNDLDTPQALQILDEWAKSRLDSPNAGEPQSQDEISVATVADSLLGLKLV